jgi:hypothetical protein
VGDLFAFLGLQFRREEGQTMAEYGVVLAVINIGAIVAFTARRAGSQARSTTSHRCCRDLPGPGR